MRRVFPLLFGLALAAATVASPPPAFFRDHCLFVKKGFLRGESSTPEQILRDYDRYASGRTLVVHFHGGLVSEANAKKEAWQLAQTCYGPDAYPVFFIWNADFFTELGNLLDRRYHNLAFRQGHLSTAAFVQSIYRRAGTGGVDLSGIGQTGAALLSEYRRFMSRDPSFRKAVAVETYTRAEREAGPVGAGWQDWLKADTWRKERDKLEKRVVDYFSPYVRGVASYHDAQSVSWSGDLLEWIAANLGGKDIWSQMKRDTADSFRARNGVPGAGLRFIAACAGIPRSNGSFSSGTAPAVFTS